jgi:hypothetical protein
MWGLFLGTSYAQTRIITGIVMDSATQKPLNGASVVVKNNQEENLKSGYTDERGIFNIRIATTSKADAVSFSYVQYAGKIIRLSAYAHGDTVNLGSVMLGFQTNSLEQVVIEGKRPPVSMRFDKQVYKASTFNNAVGGNGVDVLKNLPAFSVDALGQITFRGTSSFLLLVNGKTVQSDPATILAQIPSGNIENIEIITNPSAAYDADGRSGIINIITKNFKQEGWVLQSSVMGGLPPFNDFGNARNPQRYSAEISAGYRKNKWDLSSSLNYLRNDMAGYREGEVYTIINNIRTDFPSKGERSFERYNYGFRLAAGYEWNEKSTITGGFYYGRRFQIRDANLFYSNTRSSLLSGNEISAFDYYNPNRQQKEGAFTLANLGYEHKFSKKSSIAFTGLYERASLSGLTTNLNIPTPLSADTLQYTRNPGTNPLDAYRLKTDYKNGGFSAGYQFRYDVQDGNFLYLLQIPGTDQFEVVEEFTSGVKAIHIIHAAYLQYEGKKDNISYAGGLRMETTDRDLFFSKDNETRTLNLVNLFPNAQVRYSLDNQWNVKAGFSRRIRRTSNFELNPFPEREHSETLEQGDPDLLPELIGTLEIGLEHSYPQGSFFITPYFQRVKNPIQRTNKVFTDTILNRVFTNGEKATQIGLEMGNTQAITKWWQSIAGFNIYYFKINGDLFNSTIQAENEAWAFTLNLTQSFSFGKKWSGQLAVSYLSDRPTLQGEDSYFLNPSASIRKVSNDKRWNFQLLCQSADWGWGTSNKQRITTFGKDFFTSTNYIYEVNMIQFSIGFSLPKQNRKIVLPVSEIGEKEF